MAENIVPVTNINIPDKVLLVMNGSELETGDVTMWKVPPLLRLEKNNRQEYDPLVVSIGPYHHGKKELQSAERVKTKSFKTLVDLRARFGQRDAKLFYDKVLDVVNDLRKCYIDVSKNQYDDPYLAQMMLLDACFMITYLIGGVSSEKYMMVAIGLNELSAAYIKRDLILLENQIPFWLIRMVIELVYGEGAGHPNFRVRLNIGPEDPIHYLHAEWLDYSSHQSGQIITPPDQPPKSGKFGKKCINLLKNVTRSPCQWRKREEKGNSIYSFRSASELKARGIYFRPSACRKNSLTSFKLNQGKLLSTLEVPVCNVTKYTKSFFLNMIAYEHSGSPTICNRNVTAYVEFMKLLIDNPKDVQELREKEILKVTTLGSDEDVVKVFQELNTYGLDLDQVEEFNIVKKNIQAHYNNKVKNWIGELLYTYFRSPLAATALLAAIFLLILTSLQTYYTINPQKG